MVLSGLSGSPSNGLEARDSTPANTYTHLQFYLRGEPFSFAFHFQALGFSIQITTKMT